MVSMNCRRRKVPKALKEAGIEIPYPQRDVHVKSLPENANVSPPTTREPKT